MQGTAVQAEILEKVEIQDLFNRYMVTLDTRDYEGWADCFTEDGYFESPVGTFQGRRELLQFIKTLHEKGTEEGKRHFGGPSIIDIRNDSATSKSYYFVIECEAYPGIIASGTYIDELQRVRGQWKLKSRRQTVDPGWRPLRTEQEVKAEISKAGRR